METKQKALFVCDRFRLKQLREYCQMLLKRV